MSFVPKDDLSKRETEQLDAALKEGAGQNLELTIVDEKLREVVDAARTTETVPPTEAFDETQVVPTISVSEAREESQVLEAESNRQNTRLLFVTSDTDMLHEGSMSFQYIADLRNVFLEIHIIVLTLKNGADDMQVLRPFETVWMYPTYSSSWWKMGLDAYKIAGEQLAFSGGFRADIVVADDLFSAGVTGYHIARKYGRPFQLHIHEDFFDKEYIESQSHPALYEWTVEYLLKRVQSVRTKTEFQRHAVLQKYPELEQCTELLPSYYNLEVWRDFVPTFDLHERYPQFKFIMLHITSMNNSSHSSEVLLGASNLLRRYRTMGLIVVGNGPLRSHLERQAIALGLQSQIVFEPMPSEILSHLKTANLLLHLSENGDEDDIILGAASVKLPMLANIKGLAGRLFVDGESACLCDPEDKRCIVESINMYLNENQDRARFALAAHEIVFARVEQDYGAYLALCRDSIEHSIAECTSGSA